MITGTVHGIVFPQEFLSSDIFFFFATAVAFNTLVYLTLTVSKFTPRRKDTNSFIKTEYVQRKT